MIKKTLGIIVTAISILASIPAIIDFYNKNSIIDLNGEWLITDTIETGKYKGSVIEFRMFITQNGETFIGEGEKITLNNNSLSKNNKSRLELIGGSITSKKIRATFIEYGKNRQTRGEFQWNIIKNKKLIGHFTSTAGAKGQSIALKK